MAWEPAWTPDDNTITFTLQTAEDGFTIYAKASDGSGEALQLVRERPASEPAWSPDGRVLYSTIGQIRALSETGEATTLVESEGRVSTPRVSPDGRWIAYVSNTSGQNEVYVIPFPESGRRVTVSTNGGNSPVWSRDGHELFYVSDDRMMSVAIETVDGFRPGTPRELF